MTQKSVAALGRQAARRDWHCGRQKLPNWGNAEFDEAYSAEYDRLQACGCPARCWTLTTRSDVWAVEKAGGRIYLSEEEAATAKARSEKDLSGCVEFCVTECVVMPRETFESLCPEWD